MLFLLSNLFPVFLLLIFLFFLLENTSSWEKKAFVRVFAMKWHTWHGVHSTKVKKLQACISFYLIAKEIQLKLMLADNEIRDFLWEFILQSLKLILPSFSTELRFKTLFKRERLAYFLPTYFFATTKLFLYFQQTFWWGKRDFGLSRTLLEVKECETLIEDAPYQLVAPRSDLHRKIWSTCLRFHT